MSGKRSNRTGQPDAVIVRKAERGWVVGDENVSDLTSAMVLADLFAADQVEDGDKALTEAGGEQGAPRPASSPAPEPGEDDPGPQQRLAAGAGHRGHGGRGRRGGPAGGHRRPA